MLIICFNSFGGNFVHRGYTPVWLHELFPEAANILEDRVIVAQPYAGWFHLSQLLSLEEQVKLAESGTKHARRWLDVCHQADIELLQQKIATWYTQQPWHEQIKIRAISLPPADNRLCSELNGITDFRLQTDIVSTKIKLNALGSDAVLTVNIEGEYLAVKSLRDIATGSVLMPSVVALEWEPLGNVRVSEIMKLQRHVWQARRPVTAGQEIKLAMLIEAAAVEAGANVKVILISDAIEITTQARALGRALLGEQVMVVVDRAGSPVRGRVIDNGVVQIAN